MGQPLYCSAANAGMWGERGYGDGLPCDSAVSPCFCGCRAFLHRHFPPQSLLSPPLHPPFLSQQQPSPWDCSTIPKLQIPAAAPSRRPAFLFGICMAAATTVWFSFHSHCHRLAVSLSVLTVSPLTQTTAQCVSPPTEGRSTPSNTPVFLPSSFVLLSFAGVYVFFFSAQVLLPALSWCPACTSVSEGVFWCIRGERRTPRPPTPPPSCSPLN